ncbi:MAG: FecR domain-containing protein [Roseiarcus sp.]
MVVPALAEHNIGVAASVEKDVTGSVSGRITRLMTGDEVYGAEVIVTAVESRAQIKFRDGSDLQIGPVSHINLDSRVYSGASGAGSVLVNTTKGVFRFIGVPGGHALYQVHTPTATIGLRGTIFSVRVETGSTDAVVEEGTIEVSQPRVPIARR